MNTRRTLTALALFLPGILVIPDPGAAQALWTDLDAPDAFMLELNRPSFDDGDFGGFTGSGYVSGRFAAGDDRLLVEFPFSRGAVDGGEGFDGASGTMIGSPRIALLFGGEAPGDPAGTVGLRIPVPEDFAFGDEGGLARTAGFLGDPDRFEAFMTRTATLDGSFRAEHVSEAGEG